MRIINIINCWSLADLNLAKVSCNEGWGIWVCDPY